MLAVRAAWKVSTHVGPRAGATKHTSQIATPPALTITKRFMDDVLLFYINNNTWDSEKFVKDFMTNECYAPPLKLEEAKPDTFLETTFQVTKENKIWHSLKNENTDITQPKIWRYILTSIVMQASSRREHC